MIGKLFRVALAALLVNTGVVGAGEFRADALPVTAITVDLDARLTADTTWTAREAGVEAAAFSTSWPQIPYSNLEVTP
jgi:hypothetical protein